MKGERRLTWRDSRGAAWPRPFSFDGGAGGRNRRPRPGADAQRLAVRGDALPHGRRAHARLRHHEPRQPRPRLALHGRRLPGHGVRRVVGVVRARRRARLAGHAPGRRRRRGDRAPDALRAGSSRPGVGHLRAAPLLQRTDQHPLGTGGDLRERAAVPERSHPRAAGHPLSRLSGRRHSGGRRGGRAPLGSGGADPRRHAHPGRRQQSHHGVGARRERPAPLHTGLRPGRRAGRPRRGAGRSHLRRAARDGRGDPHPGLRRHRHRRHRVHPRGDGRRHRRRHGGHARSRGFETCAGHGHISAGGRQGGPGPGVDADLPAHGGGAVLSSGGALPGPPPLLMSSSRRTIALVVAGLLLAVVPPIAALTNQPFYVDLFRRMMIFAIAAVSLDLILGYGGMVSFGHAAYLGIGAYAVGIPAFHGVGNGFVQWGLAIVASGLVALVIGAISIRTSGVYFIMITLAFTQMLYYLGISLETYGGDNGMRLARRSLFGPVDLTNPAVFYYVVLVILVLFLVA